MTKKPYLTELTDEQKAAQIPVYLHDREMARAEHDKRGWKTAAFVELAIIVIMIVAFFIYESQFDTYSYEQEARYDSEVQTSILNNGTGRVTYNGNGSEAESEGTGQEDQQPEPNEGMPEM